MASIFSKIVAGEIPCYKIAEDDNFLAFLDIMPLAIGHTLVIPKKKRITFSIFKAMSTFNCGCLRKKLLRQLVQLFLVSG